MQSGWTYSYMLTQCALPPVLIFSFILTFINNLSFKDFLYLLQTKFAINILDVCFSLVLWEYLKRFLVLEERDRFYRQLALAYHRNQGKCEMLSLLLAERGFHFLPETRVNMKWWLPSPNEGRVTLKIP